MNRSKAHMTTVTLASLALLAGIGSIPAGAVAPPAASAVPVTLQLAHTPGLSGVGFVTPTVGWLVGNRVILRTLDGGRHFTQQYSGPAGLQDVQALNTSDVFAWSASRIVITTNGGRSWRTAPAPGVKKGGIDQVMSLHFVSAQLGFAVTGQVAGVGNLYRTTDGGLHWERLATPRHMIAAGFADAQNGWLITNDFGAKGGGFYRTTDGGLHWTESQREIPDLWNLGTATFYPTGPHTAYAQVIGQGGMSQSSYCIYRTTNGATWKPVLGISTAGGGPAPGVANGRVTVGPGYDAGPVAIIGQQDLRVVGGMEATGIGTMSLATSNDGGAAWKIFAPIPGANGFADTGTTLSFVNANDGWLLGGGGSAQTLLHTTNGGATWRELYPRPQMWPVMGVTFVNQKVGYGLGVVGDVNEVVKTVDGGRTWTAYAQLPVSRGIAYAGPFYGQGIDFAGAAGLAVGGDGHLYETQNSGKTWRLVTTPPTGGRVVSVCLEPGGKSVAINTQNGVYISRNRGVSWTLYYGGNAGSGGAAWSRAIDELAGGKLQSGILQLGQNTWASFAGANRSALWLQGQNGEGFLKSVDRGRHWTSYQFPRNAVPMVADMGFTTGPDGWLWTLAGRLFVTQDGGQKWAQVQA